MRPRSSLAAVLASLVALVTGIALTGTAHAAKPKLAVLGIETADDTTTYEKTLDRARVLTDALRTLGRAQRESFSPAPNGEHVLAELKLLADCVEESPSCMTEIGRSIGADLIMYGKLTRSTGGFSFELHYLNASTASFEGAGHFQVGILDADSSERGLRIAAAAAFSRLTGVVLSGQVAVTANVQAGVVLLDGIEVAVLTGGQATLATVDPGPHELAIDADGRDRWRQEIVVAAGETSNVTAELVTTTSLLLPSRKDVAEPPAPGRNARILFWSTAVVAAGGLTAFTVTGLKVWGQEEDLRSAVVASRESSDATMAIQAGDTDDACEEARTMDHNLAVAAICGDGESLALMTNVFVGVTAVAAAAAGYFYYTGFVVPGREPRRDVVGRRARPAAPTVVIAPQLYPSGAGIGALIQF